MEVSKIAQTQRENFLVHSSDLERKVCEDKEYVRTVHDGHEIVIHNNIIYIPHHLREQMLNWYSHYLRYLMSLVLQKLYNNHVIDLS